MADETRSRRELTEPPHAAGAPGAAGARRASGPRSADRARARAQVVGVDPGQIEGILSVAVATSSRVPNAASKCRAARTAHAGRRHAVGIGEEPAGLAQLLLDRVARAAQLGARASASSQRSSRAWVRPCAANRKPARGQRVQVGPGEQGPPGNPRGLARPVVVGPHPVGDEEDGRRDPVSRQRRRRRPGSSAGRRRTARANPRSTSGRPCAIQSPRSTGAEARLDQRAEGLGEPRRVGRDDAPPSRRSRDR